MNILAAKVIVDAGVYNAYNYLKNFGFENVTEDDINANTSLGGLTHGVTVLELTAAYGAIANGGVYHKPTPYTKVLDHDGNVLLEYKDEGKRVIKETTAFLLTDMMEDVISGGGTGGLARFQKNRMPVAGKTGTTSSEYDLWFCGYTPYLTASIWTGYDENVSLSGDQAYHERLWAKIMNQIDSVKKYKAKSFKMSKDVKKYDICSSSGKVAIKGVCPTSKSEYFAKGTQPAKCTYHSAFSKKSSGYSNSSSSSGSSSSSESNGSGSKSGSSSSGNSKSGSNSSKSSSSRTDSGSSRTSKSSSGSSSSKGSGKTVGK